MVNKFDLRLEISNYCNLECPHCIRSYLIANNFCQLNNKNVSLKTIKSWFSTIDLLEKFNSVHLSGAVAEPTLNPECIEIVKYFSNYVRVYMDSNGSTNNELWWEKLGETNIDCHFGVDSLVPNNNQYRINSNTNKVISNMKAFISKGGKASWKYIPFKHNEDEYDEQKKISKEIGAKFLVIQPYDFDENSKDQKMKASKFFPNSQSLVTSLIDENTPEKYCKLLGDDNLLEVSPDGIIYLCCFISRYFFQTYADFFTTGNPSPKIFENMLSIEKYKSFVESIIPLIENQGGIKSLSLNHNQINDILNTDIFKISLKNSWNNNNSFCLNHCKVRQYVYSEP